MELAKDPYFLVLCPKGWGSRKLALLHPLSNTMGHSLVFASVAIL